MPTDVQMLLPKTKDPSEFESMCRDVSNCLFARLGIEFDLYGKNGQAQNGIDIISLKEGPDHGYIVVQCKDYLQELTPKRRDNFEAVIKAELERIRKNKFPVGNIIFMTAYDRDVRLQNLVMNLNSVLSCHIRILFWDDISAVILKNKELLLSKYYPSLYGSSPVRNDFSALIDAVPASIRNENPFHYRNSQIRFLGREKELEVLRGFIDDPKALLWLSITGAGGCGKSKLAYFFSMEMETCRKDDWKTIWLSVPKLTKLVQEQDWYYHKNLLFIVDYVSYAAGELGQWIYSLHETGLFHGKIRVLLIDRERHFINSTKRHESLWFLQFSGNLQQKQVLNSLKYCPSVMIDGELYLTGLHKAEYLELIRTTAVSIFGKELEPMVCSTILDHACRVEHDADSPRTVIVLFVLDAYLQTKDFQNWDRSVLLEYMIQRYREHWKVSVCQNQDDLFAALEDMMLYATATGGWDLSEKIGAPFKESASRIRNLRNRSTFLSAVNYETVSQNEPVRSLHGLEPDIIGEGYFLHMMNDLAFDNPDMYEELLELILGKSLAFTAFLRRCSQNYLDSAAYSALILDLISHIDMQDVEQNEDKEHLFLFSSEYLVYQKLSSDEDDDTDGILFQREGAVPQSLQDVYGQMLKKGDYILTMNLNFAEKRNIALFSDESWEDMTERIRSLSLSNRNARQLARYFLGRAVEISFDSNGRFCIPHDLQYSLFSDTHLSRVRLYFVHGADKILIMEDRRD